MKDEKVLFQKVVSALAAFRENDSVLLDVDANERSITHKLAEALQREFSDMTVDCEYNRHGHLMKKILAYRAENIQPDDLDAKTVYPDIVIHTRGTDKNNVLVIEVKKKANSRRDANADAEKLKAFTGDDYHYQLGLYLEIDVENRSISRVECYRKGKNVPNSLGTQLAGAWGSELD